MEMEKAWLNRKQEIPPDVASLISTSRVNNCWIFHIKPKEFYTPTEFEKN